MRLKDKVAIITGAARGIGEAIAKSYAREGAKVVLGGLHGDTVQRPAEEIRASGGEAVAVKCDVTIMADLDTLVASALKEYGKIDILVNNAGNYFLRPIEEVTEEIWDSIFNCHVRGPFFLCQKVIPHMEKQGKGKIINVGSIFGENGVPVSCPYGSAKTAVNGMTRCLAIELGSRKINVNVIAPGNIQTAINDPLYEYMGGRENLLPYYPIGRLGVVEDIAPLAVYLASEESDFVTGAVFFVDGGYSAQ